MINIYFYLIIVLYKHGLKKEISIYNLKKLVKKL